MELVLLWGLMWVAFGLIGLFRWYGVAIIVATLIVANQGDNIIHWLNAFLVAGSMSTLGVMYVGSRAK